MTKLQLKAPRQQSTADVGVGIVLLAITHTLTVLKQSSPRILAENFWAAAHLRHTEAPIHSRQG
ncbi:hypothetical protein NEUTE2DRAFT_71988 [Neurospora tetrasperma FGSC 2509]|nr:hypothetical protein NEUTE2DRAFT_71988 [Neurospora tetrasperma FGSC 2509]